MQFILDSCKNLYETFSSEHKRFNYYEEKYGYIPPAQMGTDDKFEDETDVDDDPKKKTAHGTHVPVEKTVLALFSKRNLLEEM